MSDFLQVPPPSVATVTITVSAPATLRLAGSLAMRDPSADLGSFLKALHRAALKDGVQEVVVDVAELGFVNSSSIRLFIDWTSWLRSEDPSRRYVLKFLTDRQVTWQKTAFSALRVLAGEVVRVEEGLS